MKLGQSLLTKMLLGLAAAAILPFVASNIYAYQSTTRAVEHQIIDLNQDSMELGLEHLIRYIEGLNQLSVSSYFDEARLKTMRNPEDPDTVRQITEFISDVYYSKPELSAVTYVSAFNGRKYSKYRTSSVGQMLDLPAPPIPKESRDWNSDRRFEVIDFNGKRMLAIHTLITDLPKPSVLGLVSLYADLDEIDTIVRPLTDAGAGEAAFLLLYENLQLLYGTNESVQPELPGDELKWPDTGIVRGAKETRDGVFIYVQGRYLNLPLTLTKFVPRAVISESAKQTLGRSIGLQSVSLAIVILTASAMWIRMIAPLRRLVRNFAKVETGNFQLSKQTSRVDEIGMLESRFQIMVQRLEEYINREYRNRLELSTARLKMLQAQINPHFLYNALQTINTMALRRQAFDISDKIAELGAIMRYSIDNGADTVPLRKEIEHIESYLSLQAGRFKNKLSYTLSCPDEALEVYVPKMMLQPLVENSIIHGIEKGKGSAALHIGIDLEDLLRIRVMDSGKGMDEATIERIRLEYIDPPPGDPEKGGIGLSNVLQRLKLRYGADFSWSIASKPYEATIVSLLIPYEKRGEQT